MSHAGKKKLCLSLRKGILTKKSIKTLSGTLRHDFPLKWAHDSINLTNRNLIYHTRYPILSSEFQGWA